MEKRVAYEIGARTYFAQYLSINMDIIVGLFISFSSNDYPIA